MPEIIHESITLHTHEIATHGGFGQFFSTGTNTGIGTSVSSLKHVMKSTTKKKKKKEEKYYFSLGFQPLSPRTESGCDSTDGKVGENLGMFIAFLGSNPVPCCSGSDHGYDDKNIVIDLRRAMKDRRLDSQIS